MILKPTPTLDQLRKFFAQAEDYPEGSIDIPEWAQAALLLVANSLEPGSIGRLAMTTDPGCTQILKGAFLIGVYAERQGWDTDTRGVNQAERENHG